MGNDQIDYFNSGSLDLLNVVFGPLGKQILILIMIKIKYTLRSSSILIFLGFLREFAQNDSGEL